MPNIDNLIDTIQQNLNINASQETSYFSFLDLKNAYSQLNSGPLGIATLTFLVVRVPLYIALLPGSMG